MCSGQKIPLKIKSPSAPCHSFILKKECNILDSFWHEVDLANLSILERNMKQGLFVLLAMMPVLFSPAYSVESTTKSSKKVEAAKYVSGELIVKLRGEVSGQFFKQKSLSGVTVKKAHQLSFGTIYVLKVDSTRKIEEVEKELESYDEVVYAEPNYIYTIDMLDESGTEVPADPKFGQLWGLRNTGDNEPTPEAVEASGVVGADIDALHAWEITKGSSNIKIAIIDTGIDYSHPDLKDNVWVNLAEKNGKPGVDDDHNGYVDDVYGYDFANSDGDAMDDHGHGSHCAGTIGATHNNGLGVAGVMDKVTLVPLKFLTAAGSGTTEGAIQAIDYATKMNVDLMSNSWGGGGHSQALEDAIRAASDKGIIFTAAAGNNSTSNDSGPHYPSNYNLPNVVSVAAHTAADGLASFSSYGSRTVHVAAPGHRILSTVIKGAYAVYSGTSMATPHVSGVLGLLLAKEGRLPHLEMRDRLMATSIPVASYRRKNISNGRINAYNLLTNTRPVRNEPNPNDWKVMTLTTAFESDHPYINNGNVVRTLKVDGAKYIRVKVAKYELEGNYDFLKIKNKAQAEVESLTGEGIDYVTDYVEGDSVTLQFTSDSSVAKWGFLVQEIEVIK